MRKPYNKILKDQIEGLDYTISLLKDKRDALKNTLVFYEKQHRISVIEE